MIYTLMSGKKRNYSSLASSFSSKWSHKSHKSADEQMVSTSASTISSKWSHRSSTSTDEQMLSPTRMPSASKMTSVDVTSNEEHPGLFNDSLNNFNEKYLSVFMAGQRLGASYYDTETNVFYVMKDILEDGSFGMLKKLLLQVLPTVVLVSSKQNEEFLTCIQTLSRNENEESLNEKWRIEVCPGNAFGFEMAKRKILTLNGLPGMSNEMDEKERMIYFSSRISFESVNMVCAAGSLLKYLDRVRPGVELDNDKPVPILFIKSFALDDVLFVDDFTYSALQIFQREKHPSAYKTSGSKEGLSLFGVMNRTKSHQGSQLLKTWFLRPTINIELIFERQTAISFFSQPRNMEALNILQDCLKNMQNIMRILSKMKSCGISVKDWQHLYKTIFHAICMRDICKGLPKDLPIVCEINQAFSKELLSMGNLIKHIVDFEEASYLQHFVVKPGVDEELDEKKRIFDGIPNLMTKVAQNELLKLNSSITKCSVTYLPQLGYLLNIPLSEEMKDSDDCNIDPRLEFKFMADDMVYYKSPQTQELDEKLGDIQCDIRDQETAIMHRLQDTILEYSEVLHKIIKLSAKLDCILSLATAANELNFHRPEMVSSTEKVLQIVNGKHPLQEMCVSQFVCNNTNINADSARMKILTGPNASGKSVYMKQVGIIVFLAHIGSFVPAESAKISIKDGIFTRIHTRESVSVPLSTFMIDLNQIVTAVNNATDSSIVIIDEFGKGTSSTDGLALLASVLLFWLKNEYENPMVFVSTHFHQIRKIISPSKSVQYQTMDVIKSSEDIIFLYSLKEGHVDYSYASDVAKSVSIPDDVIERANEVTDCILRDEPIKRRKNEHAQSEQLKKIELAEEFLTLNLEDDNIIQKFIKKIDSALSCEHEHVSKAHYSVIEE